MARNSPSLSGRNGERQKRLRRKEYIRLIHKIWLFLSLRGRRDRGKHGGNLGNEDVAFGTGQIQQEQTFPQHRKTHSMLFITNNMSLLLPPPTLSQHVISVQTPHSVPR